MNNLVVTLETAKKLKAAGFPQETALRWVQDPEDGSWQVQNVGGYDWADYPAYADWVQVAAPTAQEIADRLSEEFTLKGKPSKNHDHIYYVERPQNIDAELLLVAVKTTTMAEALAALWLKLQEASNDH